MQEVLTGGGKPKPRGSAPRRAGKTDRSDQESRGRTGQPRGTTNLSAPPTGGSGLGGRWLSSLVLVLLLGGGSVYGYRWYQTSAYVEGELAALRRHVHTSTPEGYRRARKAAERIVARDSNNAPARAALAMCDTAMSIEFGEDRLDRARRELAATKGTDSEWRTAANAFLALIEDPGQVAGYLHKGLELYPRSALLRYLKGRALALTGSPQLARENFEAALKRAPNFVAAKTALANLMGDASGRLDEALTMLDAVLSKRPDNVQALIERAQLRTKHGKELDLAAQDARRVTIELASVAGGGQLGWAHLLLARIARLQNRMIGVSGALDMAARSPHCCDSSFSFQLAGELIGVFRMADARRQMTRALELKPKRPDYLLRMARVLLELDDPAGAAKRLAEAPPDLLETKLLQGRLSYARRSYAEALEQLKLVRKDAPQLMEPQLYIALASARLGRTARAVRRLQRLAATHPKDHRAHTCLARVLLWSGDLDGCHAALRKSWAITKLDPHVPVIAGYMYLARHDIATAKKRFARALRAQAGFRPAHLGLALVSLLRGDVAGARIELSRIPPAEKGHYTVHAMDARIALFDGKLDRASAAAARAEAAGAPPGLVVRLAGERALRQKKFSDAVTLLKKAVKLSVATPELLTLLATASRRAGRMDDAFDAYKDALRADPGYPEALVGLSRIAVRDGEHAIAHKRLKEALVSIARRGRPRSMKALAHSVVGLAFLSAGDTGRALTNLQDAMDLDPTLAEPHFLTGQTYDRLERPQRAIPYYKKALELDSALIAAYYGLGRAYAKSGDIPKALKHYKSYLARKPPEAEAEQAARDLQRLRDGKAPIR